MDLVLFDLDNTLLDGDSDYEWGRYMCEIGAVDHDLYKKKNLKFYQDYCAGQFDINAYLNFALKVLADNDMQQLMAWRQSFIEEKIVPMLTSESKSLIADHTQKGDYVIVISSTIEFLVKPIAMLFGIKDVVATQLEVNDEGNFNGKVKGVPCFAEGKLRRLEQWLEGADLNYQKSWFYSDSINDLATLKWADHAVVVNGDDQLLKEAAQRDWHTISTK